LGTLQGKINDGVKQAFPILICGIMEGIASDAAKGLTKGQLVQDLGRLARRPC